MRPGDLTGSNPGAKAQITRSGDHLTIIAAGRTAALAEDAADELAKNGASGQVEVVSLGFIKPLDKETVLKAASKTRRVLIVQDEPEWGGYAPVVRCLLDELPAGKLAFAPRILAGADQYRPFGMKNRFSVESISAPAKELTEAKI